MQTKRKRRWFLVVANEAQTPGDRHKLPCVVLQTHFKSKGAAQRFAEHHAKKFKERSPYWDPLNYEIKRFYIR